MSDVRCPICGEPWDIDCIHEEVEARVEDKRRATFDSVYAEFRKDGCKTIGSRCSGTLDNGRRVLISELLDFAGDDVDGACSDLADAEFLGLL